MAAAAFVVAAGRCRIEVRDRGSDAVAGSQEVFVENSSVPVPVKF